MKKIYAEFREDSTAGEINISPLVDVIFILLIFFILTMAFADKNSLEIDVPQAASARSQTPAGVSVSIGAGGEIFVDAAPCSLAALSGRIKYAGGRDVVVYADKSVRADALVAVVDAVKAGGARAIYIATAAEGKK